VAKADFLEAHVFDASGKAHAKGDLELRAFAGAEAFAGAKARKDLAFSWHAPGACYRAKLDAKLDLFSQPIRIELVNHGRLHAGAALSLNAVRSARLDADAKLAADAKLGADAKLTAAAKLPEIKARANLASGAKAKLDAAADAKAKAALDAKAKADAASKLSAKATVAIPKPKVEVKKSASANADTSKEGSAQAGVKAGFSLGTK
jgi:colicin import membrane protein